MIIDKHTIEFQCPNCKFYNTATIKQIRLQYPVICRGCKITLCLNDHLASVKKAERTIEQELQKLFKSN